MQLNRRRFLLGAAVAATCVAAGRPVLARHIDPGPVARTGPVTETFFGQSITDPYRWMETASDPDWQPWLRANEAHAGSVLEALPGYGDMRVRLRELSAGFTRSSLPYDFGSRLIYLSQPPRSGWPVVMEQQARQTRVLFDPGSVNGMAGEVSVEFWVGSPDGRHMILGLGEGGTEEAVIYVLDLQTGALLTDRIPRCLAPSPYWLEDGSGFFYTQLGTGRRGTLDYRADIRCRFHRLGDDPLEDRIILARGLDEAVQIDVHDTVAVQVYASSRRALAVTSTLVTKGVWFADLDDVLAGTPSWQPIFDPRQGAPDFYLDGDSLWVWGAVDDTESVVSRLDLTSPVPFREEVLATLSGGLISQSTFADDGLYLTVDGGSTSQLFHVPREGDGREIELPMGAAINDVAYGHQRRSVFVHLSTWLEPASTWQFKATSGFRRLTLSQDPDIDTAGYRVINDVAIARDGAEVPVTIITPRDLTLDGRAPCLVRAYGAYGQSLKADFDPMGLALLERGGIVVVAHVRGGGEKGRSWWRAGLGATKPNTWRDLIDVCEHLIQEGWTASTRLAILGGSAGGIAVGRALTERPDLFGLVCARAGVLNPLRFESEPNGLANVPEFGSLTSEEGFAGLVAMDTLHHIIDGVRYPTVLLSHGDNDTRVATWHTAKVAARLRAAGAPDSGPVYFRVAFDSGHLVESVDEEIANSVDLYSLLLNLAQP